MERLTKWNERTESAELVSWDEEEWKEFMGSLDVPICTELSIAVDKLAEYEDLEEQGLLLKLPCKVGSVVYEVISAVDWEYGKEYIMTTKTTFEAKMIDNFGKTVFLTKKEAEEALRKKVE